MATCKFCNEPAVEEPGTFSTDPPMCEKHLDLLLTVEFLVGQNEVPTVRKVKAALDRARSRGGKLTITNEEVQTLLPPVLESLGIQVRK